MPSSFEPWGQGATAAPPGRRLRTKGLWQPPAFRRENRLLRRTAGGGRGGPLLERRRNGFLRGLNEGAAAAPWLESSGRRGPQQPPPSGCPGARGYGGPLLCRGSGTLVSASTPVPGWGRLPPRYAGRARLSEDFQTPSKGTRTITDLSRTAPDPWRPCLCTCPSVIVRVQGVRLSPSRFKSASAAIYPKADPLVPGEHLPERPHRLCPLAVVEVPVSDSVAEGGGVEPFRLGRLQDRVRPDLPLYIRTSQW